MEYDHCQHHAETIPASPFKPTATRTNDERINVIKVIPEEETSLFFVIEESVNPLVVVNFPLLFEVEVLKTLGQMGDHDLDPYINH